MIATIDYEPRYKSYFESLNKAWLEEYFSVEPIDEWVLGNPEEAIIKPGGKILFAVLEGKIIGTVALKKIEGEQSYELTKMAVDKKFQGLGAGKILCQAAIAAAKALQGQKLVLYSTTSLANAIHIYKTLGFTEVDLEKGKYNRANIKLEMAL